MSISQSNLSDPKFGYDLVVAVTQASVNAGLQQYLARLDAPEIICCYVYDDTGNLAQISHTTLVADAKGSDPFNISPSADPATDSDIRHLVDCGFAGAIKARIGLPRGVPPASMPPVVRLSGGVNAPVLFNLLCSEFQVTGIEYFGARKRWINQSEPTGMQGEPWYFSANVALDRTAIDPRSPLTPEMQKRVQDRIDQVGQDAFTIEKLFLDLDTAILASSPQIEGIPAGSPVWSMVTSIFLGAYLDQLRQSGAPVLGYSVVMKQPNPATMQLGAMALECCALLENGEPIPQPSPEQQEATTLCYLGTTSTTVLKPVQFPWNWVELGDLGQSSGVQVVRREMFFGFLAGLLDRLVGPLCLDTTVQWRHPPQYCIHSSASPAGFQWMSTPARAADGFTDLLTVAYQHTSQDDMPLYASSVHGEFDYNLAGAVGANGNQIRIKLRSQASMEFSHKELGVHYDDLPLNKYFDKTLTLTYTLEVTDNGELQVNPTKDVADNSADWDFHAGGILGLQQEKESIEAGLKAMEQAVGGTIDNIFNNVTDALTREINDYGSWVFPGASGFVFKNVNFSSGLDLVTQVTYADQSLSAATALRGGAQ